MGGIVITNDGHCILREVDVSHPAAKSMIELSRAQVGTNHTHNTHKKCGLDWCCNTHKTKLIGLVL